MRCNHCDNAPCVTICPTVALYRRPDGIVDFDGERCIGCKSCMQACPYDALYIDPETNTAAKCHYCAHRVESGLEPACVVVCPVQAIVPGDLDDPHSTIARLVASQQTQVRKPEQGTRPKLYYLGAEAAALTPEHAGAAAAGYVFSQVGSIPSPGQPNRPAAPAGARATRRSPPRPTAWICSRWPAPSTMSRIPSGRGAGRSPRTCGRSRSRRARSWSPRSASGAGFLTADALVGLAVPVIGARVPAADHAAAGARPQAPGALPLSGLQAEPALVARAGRLHPVRGGGLLGTLWLLAGLSASLVALHLLAWPMAVVAAATAGYSAFLFGQAEGRDFWQSPLLLPHLLVAALVGGLGQPAAGRARARQRVHRRGRPRPRALGLAAGERARALRRAASARTPRRTRRGRRGCSPTGPLRVPLWGGVVVGGHRAAARAAAERVGPVRLASWPRGWPWPASGSGKSSGSARAR